MKIRELLVAFVVVLIISTTVQAALFSNDGILSEKIDCTVKSTDGYKLGIARFHVNIHYGHNDVDLFHPVVAISHDGSKEMQLSIDTSASPAKLTIPAMNIAIPENCTEPGLEKETLRKVSFEMKLYFYNKEGDFTLIVVSPEGMKPNKEIKFAKSKKLTRKLSEIFSKITADFATGTFSIANPDAGIIYEEHKVIKDQQILEELERIYKADKLHSNE